MDGFELQDAACANAWHPGEVSPAGLPNGLPKALPKEFPEALPKAWPALPSSATPACGQPPWQQLLALVERHLTITPRTVPAGRRLQVAGEHLNQLHVLRAGVAKVVTAAPDGREQVVGVLFQGDWIGLDAIASGHCVSDATVLEQAEVWSLRYDLLLQACAQWPALLHSLHRVMSAQLARERACRLAVSTLCAEARLADFVVCWAASLLERDQGCHRILLTVTRADIASWLGLSLEAVSRAFTCLQQRGLLRLDGPSRRELSIPDLDAMVAFVRRTLDDDNSGRARRVRSRGA